MAQPIQPRKGMRPSDERGMVLVVVLLLTAVLVLLGSTAVIMSTTDMKISANYKAGAQAFYEAEAGVEQVMYYLRNNSVAYPTAGSPTSTINVACPAGFSFNPSVTLHYVAPYRYRFQMTGIGTNNTSKTIEARIRKIPPSTTSADGAVAMYGGGPAVDFKKGGGGGYAVDGNDYPVPADPNCNGSACNTTPDGSLPAKPGLYTVMTPTLTGNVSAHLGGSPTQTLGPSRETEYDNFVNNILTNNLYQTTLGTRANPAITVIPNGATLNGTGNGAGIIIVDDGGELQINGNFEFEGLVILRGTGRVFGSGTGNIFGSMITIGHLTKLIDLTGSINLFYSSTALSNLQNINSITTLEKTAWRDVF
jgi:hypothetical protein